MKQRGNRNVIDWYSIQTEIFVTDYGYPKINSYNRIRNRDRKILETITNL